MKNILLAYILISCLFFTGCFSLNDEERLINDLLVVNKYDKNIRPVQHKDEVVNIALGLTLSNLVSLKESDETLTSNVWIDHAWYDYRLTWNTSEYSEITILRLPPGLLWIPDIVLENNNDGQYNVAFFCNVLVHPDGLVTWLPPAIFRSSCFINVLYFPFDWQNCSLKFTSLNYNAEEINMELTTEVADGKEYPIEWIIIDPEAFTGGEKMTLSISVLIAQSVFLLLISQRLPETALAVPLIGKYLMFIMSLVTIVVVNCVVVLNFHFRTPSTHVLSSGIKWLFLKKLPRILHMSRATKDEPSAWQNNLMLRRSSSIGYISKAQEYFNIKSRSELMFEKQSERHGLTPRATPTIAGFRSSGNDNMDISDQLHAEIKSGIEGTNCIVKHIKDQNAYDEEVENWNLVAQTIDRLCMLIIVPVMIFGTIFIFVMGTLNHPPPLPFEGDPFEYSPDRPRCM
ncbi:acetylcholine receptor subunit delta isoform X3 [Mobula birostris]|uniref:acetylcholine receptor subunit delta isoform X3 n=1 Tax=Mobula birostris TaxID=1983395 RepID=UPI003B280F02